jgi:DNA modification methylase
VLDPLAGVGTIGLVADRLGRDAILIEVNPDYCEMAAQRIRTDAPLLCSATLGEAAEWPVP